MSDYYDADDAYEDVKSAMAAKTNAVLPSEQYLNESTYAIGMSAKIGPDCLIWHHGEKIGTKGMSPGEIRFLGLMCYDLAARMK